MFIHSRTYEIEWGDCDPAGIVYYPRYFAIFDASTAHLLQAALGMTKAQWIAEYDIVGIPMVKTKATFFRPCTFGDVVTITSEIAGTGRSSFEVMHRLEKDGTMAVEAREKRVWTGRNAGGGLGAVPLPPGVVGRLSGR
jgi:4-hydroxybenzoyl-CoA thioesterase